MSSAEPASMQIKLNTFSFTFDLRALKSETILPPFSGHLIRAVILRLLHDTDPVVSADLHRSNDIRPYSVTTLYRQKGGFLPRTKQGQVLLNPSTPASFRFTSINQAVGQTLIDGLLALKDSHLSLANQKFIIDQIQYEAKSYSEADLVPLYPIPHFSIQFLTPTQFGRRGTVENHLFPDPGVLFRHLMRLAQFLDIFQIKVNDQNFYSYIDEYIFPRAYRLKTREVHLGKGLPFCGFTGWIRYKNLAPVNPNARFLPILLTLGQFLHVGNKRTAGLGEIRYDEVL